MNIVVERKYQVLKLNQYRLLHTNIYCWILQQTANHKTVPFDYNTKCVDKEIRKEKFADLKVTG